MNLERGALGSMVLGLRWLTAKATLPVAHGQVRLVEPTRRHFEAWALLRETSRLHLQPFEPAWPSDELTPAAYRRRLRRYRSDRARGVGDAFFIERLEDGALVGGVTLTNLRRGVTQSASVGYWIGLPFVRRGYASDALTAVLRHAFHELQLNRVEAACLPANRASLAVLERAGFRREGLARRYLNINGSFQDHVLLARLRDDLPATHVIDTPKEPALSGSDGGHVHEPSRAAARVAAEGRAA